MDRDATHRASYEVGEPLFETRRGAWLYLIGEAAIWTGLGVLLITSAFDRNMRHQGSVRTPVAIVGVLLAVGLMLFGFGALWVLVVNRATTWTERQILNTRLFLLGGLSEAADRLDWSTWAVPAYVGAAALLPITGGVLLALR